MFAPTGSQRSSQERWPSPQPTSNVWSPTGSQRSSQERSPSPQPTSHVWSPTGSQLSSQERPPSPQPTSHVQKCLRVKLFICYWKCLASIFCNHHFDEYQDTLPVLHWKKYLSQTDTFVESYAKLTHIWYIFPLQPVIVSRNLCERSFSYVNESFWPTWHRLFIESMFGIYYSVYIDVYNVARY